MSLKDMGKGSIIETPMGDLFIKNEEGTWNAVTIEKIPGYADRELYNLGDLEVIREVYPPFPLEGLRVGSVIRFDGDDVATKLRDLVWLVPGVEGPVTEAELLTYHIADKSTIKELS